MSQHLVSVIEILGLVVGLLGFFYLSTDSFGASGLNRVRPILPALALSVLGMVAGPIQNLIAGQQLTPVQPITLVVSVLFLFPIGYVGGMDFQKQISKGFFPFVIGFFALYVLVGVVSGVIAISLRGVPIRREIAVIGVHVVGVLLTITLIILPHYLNVRVVKLIGMVATIIAILAQFLSPMLNLFNIQTSTP